MLPSGAYWNKKLFVQQSPWHSTANGSFGDTSPTMWLKNDSGSTCFRNFAKYFGFSSSVSSDSNCYKRKGKTSQCSIITRTHIIPSRRSKIVAVRLELGFVWCSLGIFWPFEKAYSDYMREFAFHTRFWVRIVSNTRPYTCTRHVYNITDIKKIVHIERWKLRKRECIILILKCHNYY